MDRWYEAHILLHDLPHAHALGGRDGFLHVRACTEQEGTEFPRSQGLAKIFCLHFLILGEAWKIKQPHEEALFVEAIHRHRQIKSVGSDGPVLGLPAKPRLVARRGPDVLLASRHNNDI